MSLAQSPIPCKQQTYSSSVGQKEYNNIHCLVPEEDKHSKDPLDARIQSPLVLFT